MYIPAITCTSLHHHFIKIIVVRLCVGNGGQQKLFDLETPVSLCVILLNSYILCNYMLINNYHSEACSHRSVTELAGLYLN